MKIVVAWPHVLFEHGGTELLNERLIKELRARSHTVESYVIPFAFDTVDEVIYSSLLWEYAQIPSLSFRRPDFVITSKFPSYWIHFRPKVIWLIHQFRQIYDLLEHPENFIHPYHPQHFDFIRWIVERDRMHFSEAEAIYSISNNTRNRLQKYLDIESHVLYPPPPYYGQYRCDDWIPEVLIVQRLDAMKRTDLILRALRHVRVPFHCTVIGKGPERESLEKLVHELGLGDHVTFKGFVPEEELVSAYARCQCVVYAPFDEDYGYVPVEAYMSKKPVITTTDSGGPLDFVIHEQTGWVAEPEPEALAQGIEVCLSSIETAKKWGNEGYQRVKHISWDHVIRQLLSHRKASND